MIWAILAIALGGIMKGATGAGAPMLAIPVMAMVYDIRVAIVVMAIPNLLTNIWQAWHYRAELPRTGFVIPLLAGAFIGTMGGTLLLTLMPPHLLSLFMAVAVLLYIGLRLLRPDFSLSPVTGRRIAAPVGLMCGALQGATGLSAPVSLSYLNAMRLPRTGFIASVSCLFLAIALSQLPSLAFAGFVTWKLLLAGLAALGILLLSMPVGNWIGRRMSARTFDRIILSFLAALCMAMIYEVIIAV